MKENKLAFYQYNKFVTKFNIKINSEDLRILKKRNRFLIYFHEDKI